YYDDVRGFGLDYYRGWLGHILAHGDLTVRKRVVDIGCGTGRYTVHIHGALGRPVVGLDLSAGMLGKAREKVDGGSDIRLVRGDAHHLPFRDEAFDAAVLILVVHHIEDLGALSKELHRVLAPGGRVLFMTRSHEEIEASYIAMFPGVLEIDLARFPPIDRLESVLERAGFVGVAHEREANLGFTMTREQVMDRVDGRFISTLSLMSDAEFEAGREVFAQRLEERYGDGPVPTAT
ncbi:MAG: methyltransferase domain-containing protein, partial [Thermoplasmata archaeon]|nr:class I SAM-dependent methyltransferase [Thermoplasmata archaeon]NIS13671.1 class I SAM-dependent methyltransferase [Thermoplasmata archaeon]NIS21545.1 class I SAM-dependent methyltransferase [Thermoplasmata archaeon]NIT79111.1 class I SAM-dependent methyltransferase [Thermoplasmata archaeon]NIU50584.1 class I SAM-dependent methyltransferase [Thermoplasmata archaeon]